MTARRAWFRWHSWTGLTTGLLLFIVCWSGTVAVFSRELDLLLDPGLEAGAPQPRIAWGEIDAAIRAERPDWWLMQISATHGPGTTVEAWAMDEEGVTHRIHADPATGAIIDVRSLFGVQRFFRSFHMALFIEAWPVFGTPLGDLIVGLLSIPLLALLVTSLVFYRRFWRGFLKLDWRKGWRVFWSDAHKLTGVWSLWFLLVIGLTGLWYLVERQLPPPPDPPKAAGAAGAKPLPVGELVARAQRAYPQLSVNAVILDSYEDGLFEVHGQDGAWLVRDRAARVWLDSRSGEVLRVQRAGELGLYERWIETADPLHFGNFAGLWSKVPWFLFGLGLSGLCLSGAYLQAKRQERAHDSGYRGAILAAYAATVAVLLVASWFGYEDIIGYGGGAAPAGVPLGVTLFIAAWVTATLAALTVWMRWVR
ncbi:MAG: PepSY domain-containing protein [Pseudomonadota bacterium]|nr:PepSY domain-containing protein [Pseudomonadota bacterium]